MIRYLGFQFKLLPQQKMSLFSLQLTVSDIILLYDSGNCRLKKGWVHIRKTGHTDQTLRETVTILWFAAPHQWWYNLSLDIFITTSASC